MLAVFVGFLSASAEIVPYYWFQLGMLAALADLTLLTPTSQTTAQTTIRTTAQTTIETTIENSHAHRT